MNRVLPRNLTDGSVIVVGGAPQNIQDKPDNELSCPGLRTDEHVLLIRLHDQELLPSHKNTTRDEWPALGNDFTPEEDNGEEESFWDQLSQYRRGGTTQKDHD